MISATPLAGNPAPDIPRRDLLAIYPYLNRKELEQKSPRDQLRQIESTLQKLAAASRMQ
jgi:hypothetical protein